MNAHIYFFILLAEKAWRQWHPNSNNTPSVQILVSNTILPFFFWLCLQHTDVPKPGLNPHHSINPNHSSDNAKPLIHCTTWHLHLITFFNKSFQRSLEIHKMSLEYLLAPQSKEMIQNYRCVPKEHRSQIREH